MKKLKWLKKLMFHDKEPHPRAGTILGLTIDLCGKTLGGRGGGAVCTYRDIKRYHY